MKKYILSAFLFTAILSFSCRNSNNTVNKNTDSVSGNTDSSGSQPVQAPSGSADAGNAKDTIAHRTEPAPRVDSVIRH
jgi:hypothetical protein